MEQSAATSYIIKGLATLLESGAMKKVKHKNIEDAFNRAIDSNKINVPVTVKMKKKRYI